MRTSVMSFLALICISCNSPICYEQDGIEFWSEDCTLVSSPEDTHEGLLQVMDVAQLERKRVFQWYTVTYVDSPYFEMPRQSESPYYMIDEHDEDSETVKVAGFVNLFHQEIYIANVDYKVPVFRHELFHVALHWIHGNPDTDHEDPRWSKVD